VTLARAAALALVVALPHAAVAPSAHAAPPTNATLYAFFATWCVPCRAELPHIQRLHEAYGARGLRVVLVSEDAPSSKAAIPSFLARYGVTAPWIHDAESALLARYNPAANLPFTVLVDGRGEVVYAHSGYEPGDERQLEAWVATTLQRAEQRAEQRAGERARPANDGDLSLERALETTRASAQLWTLGLLRTSKLDGRGESRLWGPITRMEATAETEPAAGFGLSAHLRADGAVLSDEESMRQDARFERGYVEARLGPLTARVGDTYAAFGHGVTLSLRKVDILGADTSLQGARLSLDSGALEATALYGRTNPQNLDPVELGFVDDVPDELGGAQVKLRLPVGFVSSYGLVSRLGEGAPDGRDVRAVFGGAAFGVDAFGVKLLGEAAAGARHGLRADVDGAEVPFALYGSAAFDAGPTSWLVEGKLYRAWSLGRPQRALPYHEPPTLERFDQQVPGNADSLGPRLRAEWRAFHWLSLNANAMGYAFSQDGSDPWGSAYVAHVYGGGDLRLFDAISAELAIGGRTENDIDDGRLRRALWHVDVDGGWSLAPWLGLTAKLNHRTETKRVFSGPKEFVAGIGVFGVAVPGWATLSLLYGYSTEVEARPVHYPGAELLLELWRGGRLRVFGGRQVGGRVCVSGTCRDVPPFEGALAELILRI
jgi:thiol-disulfide isomerase/thioredoxin